VTVSVRKGGQFRRATALCVMAESDSVVPHILKNCQNRRFVCAIYMK
jgi:hypothetical protein